MEIGLDGPLEPPAWPAGVAVRPCATAADERAAFAVVDEAMRDHWGHEPEDFRGLGAGSERAVRVRPGPLAPGGGRGGGTDSAGRCF
jgi:hypothetical protein